MKKNILTLLIIILSVAGNAQPEYKNHLGIIGRGSQYSYSAYPYIEIFETKGNTTLIAGNFGGDTMDVHPDPGIDEFFNPADGNYFMLKLDTAFNYQWGIQFGGSNNGGYMTFTASKIDDAGNIYLAGIINFGAAYDLNPGAGVYLVDGSSSDKIFVVKLSPSGSFIWGQQANLIYAASCSIDLDNNGNVFLVGSTSNPDNVDFDPGVGLTPSTGQGGGDSFIVKYNATTGAYITSKTWGSANSSGGLDHTSGMFGVKSNGNLVGVFSGYNSVFLDPDDLSGTTFNSPSGTAYLIEFDNNMNFISGGPILDAYYSHNSSLHIDSDDNIYIAFEIGTAVDIDPTATNNTITLNGTWDHVIMKFSTAFEWSFQYGGGGTSYYPLHMTTNSLNELFLFGMFEGSMDLDPGAGTNSISTSNLDYFFTKIATTGTYEWGYKIGGSSYETDPKMSSVGTDIYLHGYAYQLDLDVSGNTVFFDESSQGKYHFIAKYGECPTSVNQNVINSNYVLTAELNGDSYQWVDCNNANAPISGATSQSFSPTQDGDYACAVTVGSCTYLTNCSTILGVGVSENESSFFTIYPNPSTGEVYFSGIDITQIEQIEIYDITGKLILSDNSVGSTFNLNVQSGQYFVKVFFINGESSTSRIHILK